MPSLKSQKMSRQRETEKLHFPARDAGTTCGGRCVAPSPLLIPVPRNTKVQGIHNRWDVSLFPLGRGGHSCPRGRASTICSRSPRHAPRLGTPFGAARACRPLVRAAARIGAGRANRKHPRRRYAVASRFPGTACPLQRGCPSAERIGAMGYAPPLDNRAVGGAIPAWAGICRRLPPSSIFHRGAMSISEAAARRRAKSLAFALPHARFCGGFPLVIMRKIGTAPRSAVENYGFHNL